MRIFRNVFFLFTFSMFFLSGTFCADENTRIIKIGTLLPLTGMLNSTGLSCQAAVELAVEDINAWLQRENQPYELVVETTDSATDPDTASKRIQSLNQQDIHYVVGPCASSCVEAVKPFADQQNMLILSPSSSSISLSIPNDHIYRMTADDSNQGDAVSYYCKSNKLSYIIPLYMDNLFGNSLYISTKKWVEERGGYYDEGVKVDPDASDYSNDVETLKQKVNAALAEVPSASVAIHFISYDQGTNILRLAMQDPNLARVRWIGSDGFTGNNNVLQEADICEFAQSVNLVSPVYQLDFDFLAYVERLMFRIRAKLQSNPESLALQAYDSIWLSFLAERYRIETGTEDCVTALESILPIYRGYTQVIRFNSNGDRYTGMYVFMDIKKKGDHYAWTKNSNFSFIAGGTDENPVLNRLMIQVPPDYPDDGSYTIPVLCPLTGSLSQIGQSSQKTFEIVEEDLQNFLVLHDSNADIHISVFDTQTSTEVTLDYLKSLKENSSFPVVVGPYSSEVLMGVKSYVDENDIILISPSSTATSLSIPNDNIYRMSMDDAQQSFALAAYMHNEGIRVVVPVWLDNEYGNSLTSSFKKEFEAVQGILLDGVHYASDETDFSSVLDALTEQLTAVQASYSRAEIGVLLVAFDEGVDILSRANDDSTLSAVRWFGSDGLANSKAILSNSSAENFAVTTRFTASSFAPELDLSAWKTAKGHLVKSYFENYLTRYLEKYGEIPGSFNYTSYDSGWLSAMVNFKVPQGASLDVLKQLMLLTMKYTNGYSELNRVNDNGDKGYGTFGFATVVAEDSNVSWKYNSAYHFAYEYDRDDWLEYYNSSDEPGTKISAWELFE